MIRRGAILIGRERSRVGSKPRPWLVLQSDAFNPTHPTITCCMISTFPSDPGMFRIPIAPDEANGLRDPSTIYIDVILPLSRDSIISTAGMVDDDTMATVDAATRLWLDI